MTKSLREDDLVHWVLSTHECLISRLTVMATFITENKGSNKRQAAVARVQPSTLTFAANYMKDLAQAPLIPVRLSFFVCK